LSFTSPHAFWIGVAVGGAVVAVGGAVVAVGGAVVAVGGAVVAVGPGVVGTAVGWPHGLVPSVEMFAANSLVFLILSVAVAVSHMKS
jgi:hypothetical protein